MKQVNIERLGQAIVAPAFLDSESGRRSTHALSGG